MKEEFSKKFVEKVSDSQEGIVPVAFKFSDGTKILFNVYSQG